MSSSSSTQSTASTLSSNSNTTGNQQKVFLVVSPVTTEASLRAVAATYGRIRNVHTPKDRDTQRSRGIAFVSFENHQDAVAAIQGLEGYGLDGVILHPRWANAKQKAPKKATRMTTHQRLAKETTERVEEKREKRRQQRARGRASKW